MLCERVGGDGLQWVLRVLAEHIRGVKGAYTLLGYFAGAGVL